MNVPIGFQYFGGTGDVCDGLGAFCDSSDCDTAFHNPNDNQVQRACEADNVNLLIIFCPTEPTEFTPAVTGSLSGANEPKSEPGTSSSSSSGGDSGSDGGAGAGKGSSSTHHTTTTTHHTTTTTKAGGACKTDTVTHTSTKTLFDHTSTKTVDHTHTVTHTHTVSHTKTDIKVEYEKTKTKTVIETRTKHVTVEHCPTNKARHLGGRGH